MSSTASLAAIPSCDGLYIASVVDGRLVIRLSRATVDDAPLRTVSVGNEFANRATFFRWSSDRAKPNDQSAGSGQHRILLADDHTIRVWDAVDTQWSAKIDSAGGAFGKVAQVDFGLDSSEIMAISEYGVRINIWSLNTGRCVEIKDPKFSHARGYGYRPRTGHLAMLSRPNAFDTITLHDRRSYEATSSLTLPTMDAQGLKWSPNGQWIAVWDSAAAGCKVVVYTAECQLYRTYNGDEEDMAGLGVKSLEWSPRSDYLAIARYNNRVTLLNSVTFSPAVAFDHTSKIHVPSIPVWQVNVSASNEHSYTSVSQPTYPPTTTNELNPKTGISSICFNSDGAMVATRNDSMPTSVWIWSVKSLKLVAVLIQHSHVRALSWHPADPDLLLITCATDDPVIYQWSQNWDAPRIATILPTPELSKPSFRWLRREEGDQALLLVATAHRYAVGFVAGEASSARFVSIENSRDVGNATKAGAESPRKDVTTIFDENAVCDQGQQSSNLTDSTVDVDDTFLFRKHVPVLV